jgi:ABC-type sugar transport system ATPase subunit
MVKDISMEEQQFVKIAKALTKNVKLLILGKLTVSLSVDDSKVF